MTAEPLRCPDCDFEVAPGPTAPMTLGRHRQAKHGYVSRKKGRKDAAPRRVRSPSLKADLRRAFEIIGTAVGVFDPYCGGILATHSRHLSDALADLAARDPRIARWLGSLGKAGPYGALIVAAAEVAVPIAAHHGLIAPEFAALLGAPSPVSPPPEEPSPSEESSADDAAMG